MIHIRSEGDELGFGLNFYPLSDKHSTGCSIRLLNLYTIHIRYSKVTGLFYMATYRRPNKRSEIFCIKIRKGTWFG